MRLWVVSHPMWVRGLKLYEHQHCHYPHCVAPYVGAWIETRATCLTHTIIRSHPMWVRGLKLRCHVAVRVERESHPMWVRGLKLYCMITSDFDERSHPMWVRGLKRHWRRATGKESLSHPMWVRGLKPELDSIGMQSLRRTLCGCVD